jgi:hypothetical protein
MIHEPGSLHANLRTTADQAWRLYCALELAVPHKQTMGASQSSMPRQRRTVAPIPWNSVAAELTLEFHNKIRHLEVHLKGRVTGGYPVRRGSSSANTRYAIDSVVNLCEPLQEADVLGVLNYLTGWTRRAHVYFNPEGGLHRLPRDPGQKETPCPYCAQRTMRWNPARGLAICVNPICRNTSGSRPRWVAEFTVHDDRLVFRWDELEAA